MYDNGMGFGFVDGENGKEFYTRFEGLTPEEKAKIKEGMPVSFDLQEGLRGEEAINVKLL